jgi:hypothetical protein
MAALAQIFTLIELVFKLFGLWDGFVQYIDDKRSAEREANAQARDAAIEESKKEGKSDDDVFKNQGDIVSHLPQP